MQRLSIGVACVAVLFVICLAFFRIRWSREEMKSFHHRHLTFEVQEDGDEKYYIVRSNQTKLVHKLPQRIRDRMLTAREQDIDDAMRLENGQMTSSTLYEVEEILYNHYRPQIADSSDYWTKPEDVVIEPQRQRLGDRGVTWANLTDESGGTHAFCRNSSGEVDYYREGQLILQDIAKPTVEGFTVSFWKIEDETTIVAQAGQENLLGTVLDFFQPDDENIPLPGQPDLQPEVIRTNFAIADGGEAAPLEVSTSNNLQVLALPHSGEKPKSAGLGSPGAPSSPKSRSSDEFLAWKENKKKAEPVPEVKQDIDWCLRNRELERQSLERERLKQKKMRDDATKAMAEKSSGDANIMANTQAEREWVDQAIRDALKKGDAEALREAAARGEVVLKTLQATPPAPLANLRRLVELAQSRVQQFDMREGARKGARDFDERVAKGVAPDWSITQEQFWKYAEEGSVEKVNAALRAKLPVAPKSKDGQRLTVLHVACRGAVRQNSEAGAERGLQVIAALLEARAAPNVVDAMERTPLDLAVCEGGAAATAESSQVIKMLRERGLLTVQETREALSLKCADRKAIADAGGGEASPTKEVISAPASPAAPA
jgi:hypothetical protein